MDGDVYHQFGMDALRAFAVENAHVTPQPVAQAESKYIDPGATLTDSANGTKNGIVWVVNSVTFMGPR